MANKLGYWRIEQLMEQLGSKNGMSRSNMWIYLGIARGATVYSCLNVDSPPRSPKFTEEDGLCYDVGITFRPNLNDTHVKYHVCVDSNDTYVFFVTRGQRKQTLVHEERGLADFNIRTTV